MRCWHDYLSGARCTKHVEICCMLPVKNWVISELEQYESFRSEKSITVFQALVNSNLMHSYPSLQLQAYHTTCAHC